MSQDESQLIVSKILRNLQQHFAETISKHFVEEDPVAPDLPINRPTILLTRN